MTFTDIFVADDSEIWKKLSTNELLIHQGNEHEFYGQFLARSKFVSH